MLRRFEDRPWVRLTRQECVTLLERICIQCYDHEDLTALQEAVKANLEDGSLLPSDFPSHIGRGE